MAPRCGDWEGTHPAAAACRGQAVNHAAGISRLITSPLLPRLCAPWGYAKKKKKVNKKKIKKIPKPNRGGKYQAGRKLVPQAQRGAARVLIS